MQAADAVAGLGSSGGWARGKIQALASYKRPLHRLAAPPPAPRKQHQRRCILRAGASMEFEVSYSLDNAEQFWEGMKSKHHAPAPAVLTDASQSWTTSSPHAATRTKP